MPLGDLQRHIGPVPVPVGDEDTSALPGPGHQPAGDGGRNRPGNGNHHHINPIDEGSDHSGPFGPGIRNKRKPIKRNPTLRGGDSTKRGNPDNGTPRPSPGSSGKQRQQQRGTTVPRRRYATRKSRTTTDQTPSRSPDGTHHSMKTRSPARTYRSNGTAYPSATLRPTES